MKWEQDNTKKLILRSQAGDKEARDELVRENAPLVKSILRRYLNRGVEYEDLFQIGNIGLLKAVAGFDTSYDVRFSTYAVPMINGEIKRFIRDNSTVKMPRSLKEMQQRIRYAQQSLSQKLDRTPGAEDIARELGVEIDEVLFTLESMTATASLDEPVYDEQGSTLKDMIEDTALRATLNDRLALRQCLDQLDDREKKIILLRYFKDYTQSRVADIMGVSQVQISRIESRTIEKLRRKLG